MKARGIVAALVLAGLGGCVVAPDGTVYPAGTYVTPGAPASFDRSFSAVYNAMLDQGLSVTQQDRAAGIVVGRLEGGTITGRVQQQADGSVRVQFDANGVRDPGLIDRVSRSYDQRMGR